MIQIPSKSIKLFSFILTGFGPTPGLKPESNKTLLGKEQIYQAYTLKYNLKTFLSFKVNLIIEHLTKTAGQLFICQSG